MSRIQKTVYDVVVSVVADYGRMKKELEKGSGTREQIINFTRMIVAVDNALIVVCEGESEDVIEALRWDIANKRGFSRSSSKAYYDEKTFLRRKSEVIRQIARMINLI